jgi:hypothetical protein
MYLSDVLGVDIMHESFEHFSKGVQTNTGQRKEGTLKIVRLIR